MTFKPATKRQHWFWSTGYAWGTCEQEPVKNGVNVSIAVLHGSVKIRKIELKGFGASALHDPRILQANDTVVFMVRRG